MFLFIRILGAKSFKTNFKITAQSSSVHLVDETSLLNGYQEQLKSNQKLLPEDCPEVDHFENELTFYRTEINKITRTANEPSESSPDASAFVCTKFSRFYYKINVQIYERMETLHVSCAPRVIIDMNHYYENELFIYLFLLVGSVVLRCPFTFNVSFMGVYVITASVLLLYFYCKGKFC